MRAHMYFERLNNRLSKSLVDEGNTLRVVAEEFRDSLGAVVARRAKGSIGADAIVRDTVNPALQLIFNLKTHGGVTSLILAARQSEFLRRCGAMATEIFRHR